MKKFVGWALLVVGVGASALLLPVDEWWQRRGASPLAPGAVSFGVLGDSDSHAYHDDLNFAAQKRARGGALRQRTWQWTEILAHLRSGQLDPGPWGTWGTRWRRLSILRDALGLDGRFPVKQDYLYNQAYSGAVCEHLNAPQHDQTGRLLTAMHRVPERWKDGVVLIRIGTNDFGVQDSLEALSRDPEAPEPVALIDACVREIRTSVERLRRSHPTVRIVLVGIFNNAEWERFHALWRSPQALANIHQGLARFDRGLRAIAQGDPRIAFFDEQAWFAALWGSRMPSGDPAAYKTVRFGPHFEVVNTGGDEPWHATLADGHAGTVWNALWAQALVSQLNGQFGLAVKPLQTDELINFVDPDGRFGMR
ncbi:SGNH/GDSL hydrolase family protein [Aquabacterium sp.]|uniref:SGNH/GDSL hydrolase family protein n=1 Tax=Aquabacterium sp. TaxID=1872578 RepID=UPI003D6C8784